MKLLKNGETELRKIKMDQVCTCEIGNRKHELEFANVYGIAFVSIHQSSNHNHCKLFMLLREL